jgi:hypothetical protein
MSALEDMLLFQIQVAKLPEPIREYTFHPQRRWRLDFAWPSPDRMVALEVEGGTQNGTRKSRHTTGKGYEGDCEKYNEAVLLGWKVIRVTSAMVRDGRALAIIERALND